MKAISTGWLLLGFFLLAGCAQVPQESIELSATIGRDLETVHAANRHLAQLVAVKRLQASGYSLEQIQRRLVGLDETSLKRITGMEATPRQPRAAEEPASAGAITGVRLEERVVLLLEQTSRPPGQDDLAAIRTAAAPLLQLLLARRLLGV